jgi:hypothetical protein
VQVASLVRVLDADRELAAALAPSAAARARSHLVAEAVTVGRGHWATVPTFEREPFGLLVMDGVLIRRLAVAGRSSVELFGEGDVIRPWLQDPGFSVTPHADWHVLEPVTCAILDEEFLALAAHWPQVIVALAGRIVVRSRSLALRLALAQAPSVTARVITVLWHLADRWGHVTRDGVLLELPLPQSLIAELVAARRQAVCLAIAELQRRGLLSRTGGRWTLHGDADDALALLSGRGLRATAGCLRADISPTV